MENFISLFDVAFIIFILLPYFLVQLFLARSRLSHLKWSVMLAIWTGCSFAVLCFMLHSQSAFKDDWGFWCIGAIIVFYSIYLACDTSLPANLPPEEKIRKVVVEEVARYLNVPEARVSSSCDILSMKEDSTDSDILYLICIAEKRLGISRSGYIFEIRTVDEIVAYLIGKSIKTQ